MDVANVTHHWEQQNSHCKKQAVVMAHQETIYGLWPGSGGREHGRWEGGKKWGGKVVKQVLGWFE